MSVPATASKRSLDILIGYLQLPLVQIAKQWSVAVVTRRLGFGIVEQVNVSELVPNIAILYFQSLSVSVVKPWRVAALTVW
jgi:hypothetical protein